MTQLDMGIRFTVYMRVYKHRGDTVIHTHSMHVRDCLNNSYKKRCVGWWCGR